MGIIKQVSFRLNKEGSPTGTGYVRIRDASDNILGEVSFDVSTLSDAWSWYDFAFDPPVEVIEPTDIRILVEYSGGDSSNYFAVSLDGSDAYPEGIATRMDSSGVYTDDPARDVPLKILYEGYMLGV